MNKAQIVYFSGTGGTMRVSKQLAKALTSRDIEVQLMALDKQEFDYHTASKCEQLADLVILVFAVHAFDAPEPVYDWLSAIPDGNGQAVAVISVSAGGEVWSNSACRVGCIQLFEQKGYNVFYEKMFVMPSNAFFATEEQLAIRLLQVLPSKVGSCVTEILSGVQRRKRVPITARMMTIISKLEKKVVKKFPKKHFRVNEKCTGCAWCTRSCPRKNINMIASRPSFGAECVMCLRCIYGCPEKAIHTDKYRFFFLKDGYSLDELEKRRSNTELELIEKVKTGFSFRGVRNYLLDK